MSDPAAVARRAASPPTLAYTFTGTRAATRSTSSPIQPAASEGTNNITGLRILAAAHKAAQGESYHVVNVGGRPGARNGQKLNTSVDMKPGACRPKRQKAHIGGGETKLNHNTHISACSKTQRLKHSLHQHSHPMNTQHFNKGSKGAPIPVSQTTRGSDPL